MHECCAGLLGAVLVVLMEQRGHPDQLEVAVSTLMSHLHCYIWPSRPNGSAVTPISGSNRRRWRTFLTRSVRSGASAAPPRGRKHQPSEGALSRLVLHAWVTISILEVEWRVLWKVSPRSWRALNDLLSRRKRSDRYAHTPYNRSL